MLGCDDPFALLVDQSYAAVGRCHGAPFVKWLDVSELRFDDDVVQHIEIAVAVALTKSYSILRNDPDPLAIGEIDPIEQLARNELKIRGQTLCGTYLGLARNGAQTSAELCAVGRCK